MERSRPPVRHELKFVMNYGEYMHLSRTLDYCLQRDPGGDQYNEYAIRSLYFDTVFDDFLSEKLSGVENRQKYRIRIYRYSDKEIFLERKRKMGDLIQKSSVQITRRLCEQLISGDPRGLQTSSNPLLQDVYVQMRTRLLRPAVIVDYAREAYLHPAENVRITFDLGLRSGLYSFDLFNAELPTVSPHDRNVEILEVKFDRYLPAHIAALLNGVEAECSAVSKYVLCRRFDV